MAISLPVQLHDQMVWKSCCYLFGFKSRWWRCLASSCVSRDWYL